MTARHPILDELHAVRERLLAESGGTLSGLVARLQAEQESSEHPIQTTGRIMPCLEAPESGEVEVKSQPPQLNARLV